MPDVSYRFTGDTSGLVAAVRDVAAQQEAAARVAAAAAASAAAALDAERLATVKVSDAERELAAEMKRAADAAKTKAEALGVSVSQLGQMERAAAKAAAAEAAAAASANAGTAGFDKLSGAVNKTTQVSGALGGVIAKVDPQIGGAVTSVGSLAGAFQGLQAAGVLTTAMLGPLAVAVAAGALAYAVFAHNLAEAEAVQKRYADAAAEAQQVAGDWESVLDGVNEKWRQSTGKISSAGAAAEKQIAALNTAFQAQAAEAKKTAASDDDYQRKVAGLTTRYAEALAKIKETQAADEKGAGSKRELAKATDEVTDSTKAFEQAQRELSAAMAEDDRLNGQAESAIAALQKMTEDSYRSSLTGIKAEEAARDEAQAKALQIYQDGVQAASGQADTLRTLWWEYETARKQISERSAEKIGDIREKEAEDAVEAARKAAKEEAQIERAKASSIADIAGSTHDLLIMYAEANAKKNREAAMVAFRAAQVVAVAQAAVNTALAISNALATVPYPAAPFVAAAAGLAGGVQIAAILAEKPSFHSGGMMYPDEGNATLLRGEPVINRQAAARIGLDNPAAVADMNHSGAGGPTLGGVTVLRIGRLEAREIVRSDVVSGGLIVRTAKAAAASGGNLAGRTGRRPIA